MFGNFVWAPGCLDLRQAERFVVKMALHELPAILGLVGDELGLGGGVSAETVIQLPRITRQPSFF